MIEHMLNTINCFASNGSAWLVEKISKVTINFAKIFPRRAGSYLPLPNDLKKQNFIMVNIEIKKQQQMFPLLLYCSIPFEKWACCLQSIRRVPKEDKNSKI